MEKSKLIHKIGTVLNVVFLTINGFTVAQADGGITYDNIADDVGIGISYARSRSPEFATVQFFQQKSLTTPIPFFDSLEMPVMPGGHPGVAILDYDSDGDLDIYASNGPGSANSLFQNQFSQTGTVSFIDVANNVGVAATDQDSAGVCYGDIDNDGDHDLVVLGRHAPNLLFENLGNGDFTEVSNSGIESGDLWSTSCSLGDVNGDGLLDLVVGNSAVLETSFWSFIRPFSDNQHNLLFINNGNKNFSDISTTSGIQDLDLGNPAFNGNPTITWATAMVDIDTDGDIDILFADDQASFPSTARDPINGIDRGFLHVLLNDGAGHFTDQPIILNPFSTGGWMGLSFGDLNCDRTLDFYATNLGDYFVGAVQGQPGSVPLGAVASRWFLGNGDGSFSDSGVGNLISTAFGWGTAIIDYDNDGDQDILSHGGLESRTLLVSDNPGTLLQNQGCSANYVYDLTAIPDDSSCVDISGQQIPNCTAHIRRDVRGVAVGDLNQDGFEDIVTLADVISPPSLPLLSAPDSYSAVLDETARFVPTFSFSPAGFVWNGIDLLPGNLFIELSSDNGNKWVKVKLLGTVSITSGGDVNRDGIGAVISFTPHNSNTVMSPVTGGSSHVSQHALERIFGMDNANKGTVDVLWPGGVRNRLDGVKKFETIVFPEIPCSYDAVWPGPNNGFDAYEACVSDALDELVAAGIVDETSPYNKARFLGAAISAFYNP